MRNILLVLVLSDLDAIKDLFVKYGGHILLIPTLVLLFIDLRLRKRRKRIKGFVRPAQPGPGEKILRILTYFFAILTIGHEVLKNGLDPREPILFVAIGIVIFLVIIASQHLVLPDWLYRRKYILLNLVLMVLCVVFFSVMIEKANHFDFGQLMIWTLPVVGVFMVYTIFMVRRETKRQNELKGETPFNEETRSTICSEAGLVHSRDELSSHRNEGRVLLFHNRLVFVARDGTISTIPFTSIRNIRIHREWKVVPVGLKLTDYQNNVHYLAVPYPYYWRSKIRRG